MVYVILKFHGWIKLLVYKRVHCSQNSWWWTKELSVEFYSKNKFEKLVHLVCFIVRIYHHARSPERQISLKVFENRVLRRIFGPKRDEVRWVWWRLHNEELNDLHSSPNIIRVIRSWRIRWAGHVARIGERKGVCRVLVGNLRETTWKTHA